MDVIFSLIPGMAFFGVLFLVILIWAVKKGQYEDMEGNASRILLDDDEHMMYDTAASKGADDKKGADESRQNKQ